MAEITNLPHAKPPQPKNEQEMLEALGYGAQGVGLRGVAQLVPPVMGGANTSDWRNWIPGIGSTMYNWGTGLVELGANAVGKASMYDQVTGERYTEKDGTPAVAPQLEFPGRKTSEIMEANSVNTTLGLIPHYTPTTEVDKFAQDTGMGIAEGLTTVAPGIGLPKAVVKVVHTAIPPPSAAMVSAPISGVISGALGTPGTDETKGLQPLPGTLAYEVTKETEKAAPTTATPTTATPTLPTGWVAPGGEAAPTLPGGWTAPGAKTLTPDNDTGVSFGEAALGVAAATVGAWVSIKHGPRALNAISDALRGQTRSVAEANTALRSPTPAGVTDRAIEMPLPNDAGGMTRRMASRNLNPNAVMNEYVKSPEVSATPAEVVARQATNEMINNPANSQRSMESTFRTGVEEGTGHKFPKIIDYKNAAEALTPGQRNLASTAAWYKSELDWRNRGVASGKSELESRISYKNMDTQDLRYAVQLAERDPQIVALLNQNRGIQGAVVDSMEQRGRITPLQAAEARLHNPDYMPTFDVNGNQVHSWDSSAHNTAKGYDTPPMPAWEAMIKHFDGTLRDAQLNDWRRSILLERAAKQAADPSLSEIITEQPVAAGSRNATIYTAAGPRHFRINNTAFWHGLGGGPHQFAVTTGISNAVRKIYQNMTTGLGAGLLGHPFAIKNAIRDMALIPAQAAKGMYRGELDKLTKTRLPYDPTFVSGTVATAGRDVSTVVAQHLADTLSNRNDEMSKVLRGMLGHDKVDAMVAWMRGRIDKSALAYRQSQGTGGGGQRRHLNLNLLTQDAKGSFRDPTANAVAPMLTKPNFGRIPDHIPLPNFIRSGIQNQIRGAAQSAINLNTLAHELYNVISDAPHSYLHDVNIGNPKFTPRTLAHEVQRVTGNPGTIGTGRVAQFGARNLPFYNTSVQALGSSLAAFRDRPVAVGTTVASVLVLGALAEQLSALVSGKEHVEFLEQEMANGTKARNHIIFHGPGTHPTDHTEIPIPNEWQQIHPFTSALIGHMVGTWDAHKDEDTLSRITHTLAGMFSGHVSTDTLKQTGIGAVASVVPTDLPPLAAATVGLTTGQQPKGLGDQVVSNAISGKPLLSGLTTGGGPQHAAPGQEGTDSLLLRSDSGVLKALTTSFGAATATAYDLVHNYQQRLKVSPEWAREGLIEEYRQQWKDNTQFGNYVWRHNLAQSTFGSLEDRTNQMWQNVSATANFKSDVRGEGFDKTKKATPIVTTGETPVPKDPQMFNMYQVTAKTADVINKVIMPSENRIRTQIDNLKTAPYKPDEGRRIKNQLSEDLYQLTTKKHQMLLDLNAKLSTLAGGRHVDVGSNIDWQGTIEQFHH